MADMRFESLKYRNFRNIGSLEFNTSASDVVLEGVNGQGKTNILESIYALSYGSSFRTQNFREMIAFGQSEMFLSGVVLTDDGDRRLIEYSIRDGKREIFLDGKKIQDRKEIIYSFPCIVFSHEDIDFIKGEPENRRRFFDQTFSMFDPAYLDELRRYRLILNQRNAALKNGQYSLIPLYDGRLALYGLNIMNARRQGIEGFNSLFSALYKKISRTEKNLTINYQPSWKDLDGIDDIISYLDSTRERDIKMNTTTSGIHRDRFTVYDEMGPFVQTGSTGQVRLASLLFRVAEARYFTEKTRKYPILLLDDVLLELDTVKRASFLNELSGYSQAFYTFLPRENYFDGSEKTVLRYIVKEGKVENAAEAN